MLSVIVFGLVLMAGGVFAGVYFRRHFADSLPLSVMGLILVLYLAGIFGALKAGVFLVLGLALLLWILSGVRLIREKSMKEFLLKRFGSEGVYFIIIYIILVILNVGRLAWHYDELSHWMTCVKAMIGIDDFAANPAAGATFGSYPPGMALFEYFFAKLHNILDGGQLFSEWRPYVAFQIFSFTLFFPALKRLKYNRIWKGILFAAAMLALMVMYPDVFAGTLIDPVMCAMAGAGFVYLFFCEDIPLPEKTDYIGMLCALLVLMKDAGMFFGVFVAIAFAVYVLAGIGKAVAPKWKLMVISAVPLLCTLVAKGSWKLVLNRFNTPLAFSQPLRIGEFLKIFFVGGDTTYRQETVDLFKAAMTNTGIYKLHEGITTSYLVALIVLLAGLVGLTVLWSRKTRETRKTVWLSFILALQTVLYVFFLPAVYISKFSEYESSILACFDRYIRIGYLPLLLVLVWMGFALLKDLRPGWKYSLSAILSAAIVLLCSFQWLWGFVSRSSVQDTIDNRSSYRDIQQAVEAECGGEESLLLLSDEDDTYENNMIIFIARPNRITGKLSPAQAEDDAWIRENILDRYDWVIVNHTTEENAARFSGVMASEESLKTRTMYRVNHETNRLEKIECP